MQNLKYNEINTIIPLSDLDFNTTQALVNSSTSESHIHGWIAQAEAKKATLFGLNMRQSGFNLLVLGQHGSGRTSLMQSAMLQVAEETGDDLLDLVAVYDFERPNQPSLIKLPVGVGSKFQTEMDAFVRALIIALPDLTATKDQEKVLEKAQAWLKQVFNNLNQLAEACPILSNYMLAVKSDVVTAFETWSTVKHEADNALESLMNENFLSRFRVNLLVDNRQVQAAGLKQAVIYDNDPNYQSLFGCLEGSSDQTLDFMRLRAGNLHKADGGMLLLQLRDLLADEENGNPVIEKLYRFLRNGTLQFEDSTGGTHGSGYVLANTLIPLKVKLVVIAMREDFYTLLEESPDFFDYFPIKVEFADSINVNKESYAAVAGFVAQKCVQHECLHFDASAVATLIRALLRYEEDQMRISTNFAFIEQLMLESVAYANDADVVTASHVKAAIDARSLRHQYFETQIRDSIIDNELMIQVSGEVVGQVNGLTHVELGDASFGSPIRITARCYPGQKGLINIDREVNLSGPNHDKGIFILQNWLNASFSNLAPLSLNASLVFEQEYHGVEGDSASCAELFALLSALANLPIQQGIAVTGALNQFGEVMPIGGVNEKIEGYFRVCKALGLTGKQGVIIPKRNQRHLLLDDDVVQAVKQSQFHIIAIEHVLEGIAYLTNVEAGTMDDTARYAPGTVMGYAQDVLAQYRKTLESNQLQRESSRPD